MIADTFIKRPVTAIVISIVIVLVGIIALLNLPIAQYPKITPPTVSITGNFTGADAQTVEQTTTTAIETQVNGTPGMTYMTSSSTSNGQSSISVYFDVETDINIAALDVQNRVSVAEPTLPDAVKRLGLTVRKREPTAMMVLGFYSPNETHDATFIGNYVNLYVKDALLRVKGVGDIFTRADEFSMRVWLNPEKLASLGLSPADVTAALSEQNLQIAAGTIGGNPQPVAQNFEYLVITNSRLNTQTEFENIVVKAVNGTIVYLKDVARVELGKFDYGINAMINGTPAAFMLVYQAPGANAIDAYDGVLKALEDLRPSFPKDIDYAIPNESVTVVKASINEVVHTLVEALLLVIVVVFLFLQSWRATLIPILAIPVSLIGTFIFFIPFGFTINTLTLFAFVLAIGIVVDDAIVVVEAVQHNIDHYKLSAKEATYKAMKEISGPVVAIALILAAVFVPVGFVPGIVGRLYQQFAITIAVSVMISAFVALSLTPALCSLMLKPVDKTKQNSWLDKFFARFNNWFESLSHSYTNGVAKWIKKAPYVLIMLVCLFMGLTFLFKTKPSGFVPTEDEGRVFVTYELPEAASTERSKTIIKEIMARVKSVNGVQMTGGLAGFNFVGGTNKSNTGTVFVRLNPWNERKEKGLHAQEILAEIQKKTADIKEAQIRVIAPPAIPGLGASSGFTFEIQQTSSTDDIQQFEKVSQEFLSKLRQCPEIGTAFTFFKAQTPAYKIDVDREKAKQLNVPINAAFQTLSAYLASSYVNDFNIYGRNFRVVAMADSSYRASLENLGKYFVKNASGQMVPLSAITTATLTEMPTVISHYNIYRNIEITGTPAAGYSSGQAIDALKEVAETLPAGYGYEFSGLSREEIIAGDKTGMVFAISIVFVFLFLAALYESWSIPFSVLFAVPIGAFGSILTLTFLPNLSNNIYAQIGLVTLIGLAAKNAILIVEFAKERVDHGEEIIAATLEAVKLRLRPIVMTSLAFILGVLPLAFASGAAAEARKTIGWTVFGGMLAATSLAIFVVPVLYVLITKLTSKKTVSAA